MHGIYAKERKACYRLKFYHKAIEKENNREIKRSGDGQGRREVGEGAGRRKVEMVKAEMVEQEGWRWRW